MRWTKTRIRGAETEPTFPNCRLRKVICRRHAGAHDKRVDSGLKLSFWSEITDSKEQGSPQARTGARRGGVGGDGLPAAVGEGKTGGAQEQRRTHRAVGRLGTQAQAQCFVRSFWLLFPG